MTTETTDHSNFLQYECQVLAQLQPEAESPVIDEMEREQAIQSETTKPPAQEKVAIRSEPDCSASSVGAGASTNSSVPSMPRR